MKRPPTGAFSFVLSILFPRQHALENLVTINQQMLERRQHVDDDKGNQECRGYSMNPLQQVIDNLALRSHRRNLEETKIIHAVFRELSGGKS